MLAAATNTTSENDQQLQDLESLALRLRALETLLAPPSKPKPVGTSNGSESPTEDTTEETMSTSSPPRRGDHVHYSHPHHHHPHSSKVNQQSQQNHAPGSLSRRIQNIETTLWTAAKERKPIDEFLQKCEASKLIANPHSSHPDRELLTLQSKLELILAAQEELQKLAEESKDIQNLQRCAEIGGLKNVESQYPILARLETIHIEQCQESNTISDKMNKLTDDYNGLINTLSEVFLSWDALLSAAELKVSEMERTKK